ncbi:MAG: 4-alpha-glucanotransferase [Bacillota bacterium]
MSGREIRLLHRLCRLYGIETGYLDIEGRRRQAPPDSLLAVLRALGAPLAGLSDVPGALRERTREHWDRLSEPVAVSWDKNPVHLELRLPVSWREYPADCGLELENGGVMRRVCRPGDLPLLKSASVEGMDYEVRRLSLPSGLPWGYHRLTLNLPARRHEVLIISAPRRAFTLASRMTGRRIWGGFLPLYALHSARSPGAGDFTDLDALLSWVRDLGGSFVGTLPLLAAFLDQPFSPSPYEPVSRLFWNEFYIDVGQAEEFKNCPEARELSNSPAVQEEGARLRAAPLVDYHRGMAVKRKLLEYCAGACFAESSGRQEALRRWMTKNPAARDYARFRAAVEKRRTVWTDWPGPMRDGILREGDYDPEAERYHLYVQWLAHQQLRDLSARARRNGQNLYLDFPLGVHRHGYDVWRERTAFVPEASGGAPPDAFFTGGQNWGLPPLHPERIRVQGYRYYIAGLRNHLQHAGILRLDHVMGLHRLFWVPGGLPAGEGVYVRYHAEEFYAVLALESHRHRALLVGEDLGLVPGYVRTAMARHRVYRMYVLPFEYTGDPQKPLRDAPAGALAALNTHDMPPFASFWLEKEKKPFDRAALPVFLYHRGRLKVPTNNLKAVFRACLGHLAASRAEILLVNLEDLWLETEPQNIPGTTGEYPNWRRKARLALEEFSQTPEVLEALQEINGLRR